MKEKHRELTDEETALAFGMTFEDLRSKVPLTIPDGVVCDLMVIIVDEVRDHHVLTNIDEAREIMKEYIVEFLSSSLISGVAAYKEKVYTINLADGYDDDGAAGNAGAETR